jgi:hypothetical protein
MLDVRITRGALACACRRNIIGASQSLVHTSAQLTRSNYSGERKAQSPPRIKPRETGPSPYVLASLAPNAALPAPQRRGRQAGGECPIREQHPPIRKMPVESGREPWRDDVVIHDIGQRGNRTGGRDRLRRPACAAPAFVDHRPEDRARMMDRVADGGMAHVGAATPLGGFPPDPVAGGIGGGGKRAGARMSEQRHR